MGAWLVALSMLFLKAMVYINTSVLCLRVMYAMLIHFMIALLHYSCVGVCIDIEGN